MVLAGDAAQNDRAVMWGSHTIPLNHVGYGARLGPSKVWGGNRDAEKKLRFFFFFLKIGCFCVLKILRLLIQELAGGKGGRLGLSWLCLCPRASCVRRGHNV